MKHLVLISVALLLAACMQRSTWYEVRCPGVDAMALERREEGLNIHHFNVKGQRVFVPSNCLWTEIPQPT